ncbi:MAG: hypothetical protein NZ585_05930 [Chloracidobacterium sp.]|nr:hypothetical protein [Chloracidobacterium sp.]MDW8216158.1 hypothetical protein [Acidobacteriota bacterium]
MFVVRVANNAHYMDDEETYIHSQYPTWAEAVAAARQIVDRSLTEYFQPGMDAESLYAQYMAFGDDPYIVSPPEGEGFSAREYAKQRCIELCSQGAVASEARAASTADAARTDPKARSTATKYLRVTINDTLGFWDDNLGTHVFNPNFKQTFTVWYRVPENWVMEGTVGAERREAIFRHLYGDSWRLGNADGSKYFVLACDIHVLTPPEVEQRPWLTTAQPCYVVAEADTVEKVSPETL